MNNTTHAHITSASWSKTQARLGEAVSMTASLAGVSTPTTVTFVVSECVTRPMFEGGGYRTREVATLTANVEAGAGEATANWVVSLSDAGPAPAGIPQYRFTAALPGSSWANSPLLSIGSVRDVSWLPPGADVTDDAPPGLVRFAPGQAIGLRARVDGLTGFLATFTIHRTSEDETAADTAVTRFPDVPLNAGVAWVEWLPDSSVDNDSFTFDVAFAHPAAQRQVKPQKQRSQPACKNACLQIVKPKPSDQFECTDTIEFEAIAFDEQGKPRADQIKWFRRKNEPVDRCDPIKRMPRYEPVAKSDDKKGDDKKKEEDKQISKVTFKFSLYDVGVKEGNATVYAIVPPPDEPVVKPTTPGQQATVDVDFHYVIEEGPAKGQKRCNCKAWLERATKHSASDVRLLARLIMAEGIAVSKTEKRALGYAVLNRFKKCPSNPKYGPTIYAVLKQGKSAQFDEEGKNYQSSANPIWVRFRDSVMEDQMLGTTLGPKDPSANRGLGPTNCTECLFYQEALEVAEFVLDRSNVDKELFNTPAFNNQRAFFFDQAGERNEKFDPINPKLGDKTPIRFKHIVLKGQPVPGEPTGTVWCHTFRIDPDYVAGKCK